MNTVEHPYVLKLTTRINDLIDRRQSFINSLTDKENAKLEKAALSKALKAARKEARANEVKENAAIRAAEREAAKNLRKLTIQGSRFHKKSVKETFCKKILENSTSSFYVSNGTPVWVTSVTASHGIDILTTSFTDGILASSKVTETI